MVKHVHIRIPFSGLPSLWSLTPDTESPVAATPQYEPRISCLALLHMQAPACRLPIGRIVLAFTNQQGQCLPKRRCSRMPALMLA